MKYCSDECRTNHREQHEQECSKRVDELSDKKLFTDGSHMGECPICCLPLSIYPNKSSLMSCCCKIICNGCAYANTMREVEAGLEQRCAFCREPAIKSDKEHEKQLMKRIKKHNDPVAMTSMGKKEAKEGELGKALKYWTKAAELGHVEAHCCLGEIYFRGTGVERDMKKAVHHLEQAAIGGHDQARGLLADYESKNGRPDRAAKHLIINANLGCNESLQWIKYLFVNGIVSKEDYAAALRGYQAAVDATTSAEREKAEAVYNSMFRSVV